MVMITVDVPYPYAGGTRVVPGRGPVTVFVMKVDSHGGSYPLG